jgi:hypothetical protein
VVRRKWLPVCLVILYQKPFSAWARSVPERSRGSLIGRSLPHGHGATGPL